MIRALAALVFLGAFGVGCQSDELSEADQIFQEKVQPIFEEKCTNGCHVPMGYASHLLLGKDHGPENVVNVKSSAVALDVVEPGNPAESYLWHKLNGTHETVGGDGDPMPPEPGPLSADQLAAVEEFILAL